LQAKAIAGSGYSRSPRLRDHPTIDGR